MRLFALARSDSDSAYRLVSRAGCGCPATPAGSSHTDDPDQPRTHIRRLTGCASGHEIAAATYPFSGQPTPDLAPSVLDSARVVLATQSYACRCIFTTILPPSSANPSPQSANRPLLNIRNPAARKQSSIGPKRGGKAQSRGTESHILDEFELVDYEGLSQARNNEDRCARRAEKRARKIQRLEDEDEMKFSHSIQFNAVPDWSSHYIAYSNLKKL